MSFWDALRVPMPDAAVEWRVSRSGDKNGKPWAQIVPYASARFLMDRLDEVLTPGGWQTSMEVVHTGHLVPQAKYVNGEWVEKDVWMPPSIVCAIAIKVEEEWVWKSDAAEFTDFAPTKGGATHAFRRACVPWDVAGCRLLYTLDGPVWANIHPGGGHRDKIAGAWLEWDPPNLFGPDGLLNGGTGSGETVRAQHATVPTTSQPPESGGSGGLLDRAAPKGKFKGQAWSVIAEQDAGYVLWAVENTDWFSAAEKATLVGLVSDDSDDGFTEPEEDDLPF